MSAASIETDDGARRVVIVGGGLAGLAAAVGLAGRGLRVELLEAKQSLGGRAGSFPDPQSDERLDHCQHVAMGCCTNFLDLCERTGCLDLLERHRRLYFFSADGRRSDFQASAWLPAPLHLLPSLLVLKHLSWRDKLCIGRAMLRLMRFKSLPTTSAQEWLERQRQTPAAIERFWKVVLVSALADSLDRVSLAAARKVFIDGFLAHRDAADVYIPRVSLGELYDERIAKWLASRGVVIRLGTPVRSISAREPAGVTVNLENESIAADVVIVAVPWRQVAPLLDEKLAAAVPSLKSLAALGSSPISSVHLWTDRPIMNLPHAVLIDRLSQWIFARSSDSSSAKGHYYQVVISASRDLAGRPKEEVLGEVWTDLQAVFPAAREAKLLSSRLITQREAVFSSPQDVPRVPQRTSHSALVLAGDWTDTDWPATMEGAVRSGYLAAEQVLRNLQSRPNPSETPFILQPDLPRGWLARWLIR
jgi:squalene-associated FAD-dependent desaturase